MTDMPFCGQLALPKFRRQAEGMMSPCVREPGHTGNHVYAVRVDKGVDYRSHALHYLEEVERTELKPDIYLDLRGQVANETDEELAGLYQYLEAARK